MHEGCKIRRGIQVRKTAINVGVMGGARRKMALLWCRFLKYFRIKPI